MKKKKFTKLMLLSVTLLFGASNVCKADSLQFVNRQNSKYITPGDELAIGTEHFYVIYSDNKTTRLLTKYNLNVGEYINTDTQEGIQLTEANGQHSSARIIGSKKGPLYGDVTFAEEPNFIWTDKIGGTIDSIDSCNPGIIEYVYDDRVTFYDYIESYVSTLKTMGLSNKITGRALSYDDIYYYDIDSKPDKSSLTSGLKSLLNYDWFTSTSYWLGSLEIDNIYDTYYYQYIDATRTDINNNYYFQYFNPDKSSEDFILNIAEGPDDAIINGVRPVIEIPTSEVDSQLDLVHYPRPVGDEITIGSEHFYVIYSDYKNTLALAKYNLDIGPTIKNEATKGIQNKDVLGFDPDNTGSSYGEVSFATDKYWETKFDYVKEINGKTYRLNYTKDNYFVYNDNSNLAQYINAYVSTLKSKGASQSTTGRVMAAKEIWALAPERDGCRDGCNGCSAVPSWIFSSSYWLGNADGNDYIEHITQDSELLGRYVSYVPYSSRNGVRPLINIPTSELPGTSNSSGSGSSSGSNSGSGSGSSSGSSSGSNSGSGSVIGNIVDKIAQEISDNPKTGTAMVIFAWIVAMGALGYSVYYFKNQKQDSDL